MVTKLQSVIAPITRHGTCCGGVDGTCCSGKVMKNLRDKFYSVTNELMERDTLGIILRAMKN